jgi:hypothetical protein
MCRKFAAYSARNSRALKHLLAVAVVGIGGSAVPIAHAGSLTSTWLSETTDSWTNAARWSSNPNYPNNVAGTTYNAVIGAAGGTAYQVNLASDITLNSLTVSSADATLNQTDGTFQGGTVNLNAGGYILNGGTLANTTLNLDGGTFLAVTGSLNGVAVTGGTLAIGVDGGVSVQNGLTVANQNVFLQNNAELAFDGASQSINNLNFTTGTTATITTSGPTSTGGTTLTLGSGVTVHDGINFPDNLAGDTLINNGVITADADNNGDYNGINISTDNFVNNGTLTASNGSSLRVGAGNWTNNGTITATASSGIILSASGTNAGTIVVQSGGALSVDGYLDNTNNTIDASAGEASLTLSVDYITGTMGDIVNGTVKINNSTDIRSLVVYDGELDNTRVMGGDVYVFYEGALYINHNFSIDSHNLILEGGPISRSTATAGRSTI